MEALLGRLRMKAALSLEPLLALVPAVARDLRDDFLPFLPRLIDTLTSLVNSGPLLPLPPSHPRPPSLRCPTRLQLCISQSRSGVSTDWPAS